MGGSRFKVHGSWLPSAEKSATNTCAGSLNQIDR